MANVIICARLLELYTIDEMSWLNGEGSQDADCRSIKIF